MQYLVIFEETPLYVSAYCPDLPGCVAVGETKEKSELLMREAIEFHVEGLKEDGLEIPRPHSAAGMVSGKPPKILRL